MRNRTAVFLAAVCLLLSGCSAITFRSGEETSAFEGAVTLEGTLSPEETLPLEETVASGPSQTPGENGGRTESPDQEYPGQWKTDGSSWESETDASYAEEEPAYQPKLMIASDIHYLSEGLAGGDSESFDRMALSVDGRAVHYLWEITDTFIEEVIRQKPEALILCGDLTMNGEKESHEAFAQKLEKIEKAGIPVLVIPGNHDINNPDASGFDKNITYEVPGVTPQEFAQIYDHFGYQEALSRDESSLSYMYRLDDNYWIMMLDTCQYTPVNLVGGMVQDGTYDWIEKMMDEAWEEGVSIIPVTHHNLLDQSGVSKEFYDNCTIEHDEKLINLLEDYGVILHLSGHLHVQHFKQKDDTDGITEIVSSSLTMAPFQYGVLKIMDTGNMEYHTEKLDVSSWAKKHGKKDENLLDFGKYGEEFLKKVTYQHAYRELSQYIGNRDYEDFYMTKKKAEQMSDFYSMMCRYYYAGEVYLIREKIEKDPAFKMWVDMGHMTGLSDFLNNILEDAAENFNCLVVEY